MNKLPRPVILLGLVSLLNDAASEMIYPLLPIFLSTTLGATPIVIGLIEGAADGLSSILKFFAGKWSDSLPRRKPFIAWGYALAAGSRVLIAFAASWPAVLSARLIDRTGKGMRSAPRDALISDVTPPESRGRAFGFHRGLDHLGAVIGPLLAMAALLVFPLRTVFLLAVIPGAIAVLLILFLLREEPRAPRTAAAPKGDAPPPARFWRAMTAIALFALANSSDAFLILQAHAAGVPEAMLPLLWAAHHVVKSLLAAPAGRLSDRTTRQHLLVTGWVLYAIVYAIFPMAHSLTFFFALFVVYALPFALTEGAERAWIADLVTPESRGRSFGIYYLTNGLGVLAGTALFGVLYQRVSPMAAFGTGAVLAICAALVALTGIRLARHPSIQI